MVVKYSFRKVKPTALAHTRCFNKRPSITFHYVLVALYAGYVLSRRQSRFNERSSVFQISFGSQISRARLVHFAVLNSRQNGDARDIFLTLACVLTKNSSALLPRNIPTQKTDHTNFTSFEKIAHLILLVNEELYSKELQICRDFSPSKIKYKGEYKKS